ncbi:hypothetical protein TWF506_006351 [Arthrobotrys conoides]|uniref:Uncharacterized protein n=1 Tax=Arthrobotrys conoides TaxID=74498 RepID=A0AAN8NBY4_9PEZI
MRLLHVAALALGLASSCSFAHEAPDRDSPDRKRDHSVDDYYATSWTETVTRGASVVVIVHPHAQTRPHDDEDDGNARASTGPPPQPYFVSSTVSSTAVVMTSAESIDAPAGSASSSPAPTPQQTAGSPLLPSPSPPSPLTPSTACTSQNTSSPSGWPAELEPSPIETFPATPYFPAGYPKGPLDSSQNQKCIGGTYDLCVASYNCRKEPYDAVNECHCRNNVKEGCWYTCGGFQAPQPEECPLVPAESRPPGLPGPGEGETTSTSTVATSTRRSDSVNRFYDFGLLKRQTVTSAADESSHDDIRSRRRRSLRWQYRRMVNPII